MRAAEEPGIPHQDSKALIERADVLLDRLAETPTNAEAAMVANILFGKLRR